MVNNIFKTFLLTLKRSNNGVFEIIYQSSSFNSWKKENDEILNIEEINALFPTLNNSLFDLIFESLEKNKTLEIPLVIDSQSFIFLKFEGCILTHNENSNIINTIVSQEIFGSCPTWIINFKDQSILTEVNNTEDYFPSNLDDFRGYLRIRFPFLDQETLDNLLNQETDNAEFSFINLKFKSKNISADYRSLQLEEYHDNRTPQSEGQNSVTISGNENHEIIYFKYLKKSKEILWSGPLCGLLGYEDGNLRSFILWDWLKIIHPDDRKLVEDFVSLRHYDKDNYSFTYRVRNNKGTFQYLTNNIRVFKSAITQEEGLTGTLIDAIQHKKKSKTVEDKNEVLQNLTEKNFIQNMLSEVSAICTLFKGQNLFEEINHLIYRKLGIRFCIIGNVDPGINKMEVLSICESGKNINDSDKWWENLLNDELLPIDPANNFLMISSEKDNVLSHISYFIEHKITSLLRLALFDTEMNKIGTLCLLHDQPFNNKAHYGELFSILRDWISKELNRYRFENVLQETNFMHDAILNGTAYAIFAVNHQFELILINNKTLPVFNLQNKDELMKTKLIKSDTSATLLEVISGFLKSGLKTDYFHLPIGEDDYKELKISFTKIQYGNENKESYVIFVDDITDRTLSEKKLIASEQLFRSIAENFPRGSVAVLDKSLNYLFTDGEEYKLSGTDPKSLIGTNFLKQLSGDNLKITKISLNKVLRGQRVSYETEGRHMKFLQSGVPLINNSKEVDRILLVTQNITQAKRLESDKEKLIKDLKSHNEELLRFAYIVSHNLRAPIVNISLLLDLYNDENPADPGNREVWENLKISTNLLDTTLQDLIEVVSIKKQKIPKVEQIDFKLLLNNIEKSLFNQLKESGIKIEKDFSGLNDINYVYAHLENFFMNFMTNSVKYKHPERSPIVKIKTYIENEYCVIRFEDNGIGLDLRRYGDRIFGLYQRFHNHVEGKGLGLYLIREQIRAHDGKIEIESEVGKGTVFKVYLRNLIMNHSL
ncbi:ATP-binding protein [uncultured Cyclobacterium sp.]|uniref:ATP-binding protein n=1 Tax=uncultured Cyclobacterium sp. TaxID=453820 RepID=UPI0030EB7E50|tara:strand:+ start:31853 stop:34840 length:2988 start_codon:yes stop_codon:yes gene_type:complete